MKKLYLFFLTVFFILSTNSCVIFNGAAVWHANNTISKSVLSAENEKYQQESAIELIVVKRGLWSIQSTFRNSAIEMYFKSLMNNDLVFSSDNTQKEFARQVIQNNNITIYINNNYFNYTDYENAILLIAVTSTLALLHENNNQNDVKNMFFKFIDNYGVSDVPGIYNTLWFKNKNITITSNAFIIG